MIIFWKIEGLKKDYKTYSYYKTNLELLTLNESLQKRVTQFSKELERAHKELIEKDAKLSEQENEIVLLKNQALDYQKQITTLTQQNDIFNLTVSSQANDLETQRVTIDILKKEVEAITQAQIASDQEIERLLSEKSSLINSKFQEFMKQDPKFKEVKLPDYFKHSYNFNYEPFYDQVPQSSVINPNYNESKMAFRIKMTSEDPLNTISSHTERQDEDESDEINYEKTPKEKWSQSEKPSQYEKGSAMLKKPQLQTRDSFISELDLGNAFNNATNVNNFLIFQNFTKICRI